VRNRSKLKQANLQQEQATIGTQFHAGVSCWQKLRTLYAEAQTGASLSWIPCGSQPRLAAESLHLTTLRYQAGEATRAGGGLMRQNTATLARNAFSDGQSRYRVALAGSGRP